MIDLTKNKEIFSKLPKPKAIIFDWDNTLVDTWPLIQASIDNTMLAMNRTPWGIEKVKDNVHKSMRESFPEIFGDDWQKAGEIYKNNYRSMHLKDLFFLPNALELIDKISELGILQFVVSNKIGATLRLEAEKLGVAKKFFALIGSNDAYADKPSKDPVELAILGSDLDLQKDEIWFVGDTIADVECAYNTNCRPIIYADSSIVSKTIPTEFVKSGKNNQGAIATYSDHQEMIELLSQA